MRVERTNNDFADHPPTAEVLGLGASGGIRAHMNRLFKRRMSAVASHSRVHFLDGI